MENSRNTGEEWKRAEVVSENLRRPLLEVDRIDGEGDESGVDNDGGERNGNENETLDGLFRRFVESIVRPEDPNTPIIRRITVSCVDTAPHLKEASRNTASDVIQWSREGNSPLRALFAISVSILLSCFTCTKNPFSKSRIDASVLIQFSYLSDLKICPNFDSDRNNPMPCVYGVDGVCFFLCDRDIQLHRRRIIPLCSSRGRITSYFLRIHSWNLHRSSVHRCLLYLGHNNICSSIYSRCFRF